METETLSAKLLEGKFQTNVYSAAKFAETFNTVEYPSIPTKPFLNKNYTSDEAFTHAKALKQYEADMISYRILRDKYRAEDGRINSIIEDYIKEVSGFYSIVPEQYQNKVYSLAWSNGHSSGFSEIYNYLIELVNIFE